MVRDKISKPKEGSEGGNQGEPNSERNKRLASDNQGRATAAQNQDQVLATAGLPSVEQLMRTSRDAVQGLFLGVGLQLDENGFPGAIEGAAMARKIMTQPHVFQALMEQRELECSQASNKEQIAKALTKIEIDSQSCLTYTKQLKAKGDQFLGYA
jgi:hypothetical protein